MLFFDELISENSKIILFSKIQDIKDYLFDNKELLIVSNY